MEAKKSYITSLVDKGKRSCRKLKKLGILSPRQTTEIAKYARRIPSTSTSFLKDKRRVSDANVTIGSEEREFMEEERDKLTLEMTKRMNDRNQRTLLKGMEETYSLRRQQIVDEQMTAGSALKAWPAIKMYSCVLQDLSMIDGITMSGLMTSISNFSSLTTKIIHQGKAMRNLPARHPVVKLLAQVDNTSEDSQTNRAIAAALLPYLMPTTSKKPIHDVHRFLIDCYPATSSATAFIKDLPGRNQPCMIIGGAFDDIKSIVVACDGIVFAKVAHVTQGLSMVMALHFILNAHYNEHLKLAMIYLEKYLCGLNSVEKTGNFKSVVAFAAKLK